MSLPKKFSGLKLFKDWFMLYTVTIFVSLICQEYPEMFLGTVWEIIWVN